MKKIIRYLFIELTLVGILIIIFPSFVIREKIGTDVEGGKPILSLQTGKFYTQKISNSTKSINSISLQLKNPQIKDNSLIYIEIMDETGKIQKDFSIYGSNVGDPSWIKLDFSPIDKTNLILRVSGESQVDNALSLFAKENGSFDLKTTDVLPNFKSRIKLNINSQINQFINRSLWHNILYLTALLALNLYLAKLLNETSKKT